MRVGSVTAAALVPAGGVAGGNLRFILWIIIYPKDRPVDAKERKVTKNFDHIWYSMMTAIPFSTFQLCLPTAR